MYFTPFLVLTKQNKLFREFTDTSCPLRKVKERFSFPTTTKHHYNLFKSNLLEISLELATNAQRDRFAERPVNVIR